MQYTEFILKDRHSGEYRKLRAYIDPKMPLSEELGIFYREYDIVESRVINRG